MKAKSSRCRRPKALTPPYKMTLHLVDKPETKDLYVCPLSAPSDHVGLLRLALSHARSVTQMHKRKLVLPDYNTLDRPAYVQNKDDWQTAAQGRAAALVSSDDGPDSDDAKETIDTSALRAMVRKDTKGELFTCVWLRARPIGSSPQQRRSAPPRRRRSTTPTPTTGSSGALSPSCSR